jgi:hypothetical protein
MNLGHLPGQSTGCFLWITFDLGFGYYVEGYDVSSVDCCDIENLTVRSTDAIVVITAKC